MEDSLFDYKKTRTHPTPRMLHFMQIVDSRFNENEELLKERISLISTNLEQLPDVKVTTDRYRKVYFGEPEPGIQYRVDFYVSKSRSTTWETIMHIVNNVKAVPYDFVKA